jgi:hypothetical protein
LSQHYGVDGFPLEYVKSLKLAVVQWAISIDHHDPNTCNCPDFFNVDDTDYQCHRFAKIAPLLDTHNLRITDEKFIAQWESGCCANHPSDTFWCDDAILFHFASIAYADSLDEIHFISKKGKSLQSSQEAYFACKG